MRRALVAALVLGAIGVVLGATVVPQAATAPPLPSFIVANTSAQAVPVREQSIVGEPLQRSSMFDDWGGSKFRNFFESVPEGKLFVIQAISVRAEVPEGQDVKAEVNTGAFGVAAMSIPLIEQGTFSGRDLFVGTLPATYFASGNIPNSYSVSVVRNSDEGNGGPVEYSVSGYLVDRATVGS